MSGRMATGVVRMENIGIGAVSAVWMENIGIGVAAAASRARAVENIGIGDERWRPR